MPLLNNPRFVLAMRVLFVMAGLFSVVMALLPMPPGLPFDSLGDKFAHMLAFATVTGLAALAFPDASLWRSAERFSFLGALIEVAQSIPGLNRDCDIEDWIADTLAIVIVTVLAGVILPWLRRDAGRAG